MPIKTEFRDKAIRSYVIRAGRMTPAQRLAFDHTWDYYGLHLDDGLLDVEQAFGASAPLIVEIGFGMGDSLLQMARAAPHCNFVGVEVHPPGVGSIMRQATDAGLNNLRIYMADAVDVLEECIPESSLDRLQLYFPDPWHKKKHLKRRLVQAPFMQLLRSRLRVGGVFHMATDWQPYAEHALDVMTHAEGYYNCVGLDCYAEKPDYRPETKFERRGERLGHGVWDLLFAREA